MISFILLISLARDLHNGFTNSSFLYTLILAQEENGIYVKMMPLYAKAL